MKILLIHLPPLLIPGLLALGGGEGGRRRRKIQSSQREGWWWLRTNRERWFSLFGSAADGNEEDEEWER